MVKYMNDAGAEILRLNTDLASASLERRSLIIQRELAEERLKDCRRSRYFRWHLGCGLQTGEDNLGCSATYGLSFP
jgi:hypothetical protein